MLDHSLFEDLYRFRFRCLPATAVVYRQTGIGPPPPSHLNAVMQAKHRSKQQNFGSSGTAPSDTNFQGELERRGLSVFRTGDEGGLNARHSQESKGGLLLARAKVRSDMKGHWLLCLHPFGIHTQPHHTPSADCGCDPLPSLTYMYTCNNAQVICFIGPQGHLRPWSKSVSR